MTEYASTSSGEGGGEGEEVRGGKEGGGQGVREGGQREGEGRGRR